MSDFALGKNMDLKFSRFRRDIDLALHSARKTQPYVVTSSKVYFTNQVVFLAMLTRPFHRYQILQTAVLRL